MLRSTSVFLTSLITGVNPVWVDCEREAGAAPRLFREPRQPSRFCHALGRPAAATRERTRPVAARDYWGKTKLTRAMAVGLFNALLIARDGITRQDNPIEQMAAAMREGDSLILFPEGTRSPRRSDRRVQDRACFTWRRRCRRRSWCRFICRTSTASCPKGHLLPIPCSAASSSARRSQLGTRREEDTTSCPGQQALLDAVPHALAPARPP